MSQCYPHHNRANPPLTDVEMMIHVKHVDMMIHVDLSRSSPADQPANFGVLSMDDKPLESAANLNASPLGPCKGVCKEAPSHSSYEFGNMLRAADSCQGA